jgi:hypothetical protein
MCDPLLRAALLTHIAYGGAMPFRLTDEQQHMLELVADSPLVATPEMERYTAVLAATRLIALDGNGTWAITKLGEAMLERQFCTLH